MFQYTIPAAEGKDDSAFMEELYTSYNRLLYSELWKELRDPWDVEDALQITLVKLIDKVDTLRKLDERRLVSYLVVAARNNARSILRRKRGEVILAVDDEEWESRSVEDAVLRVDLLQSLSEIWPRLDERSRYLLEAKYILEMPTKEIAESLHIKPESVRMELSRARRRARKLLEDEEEPAKG